MTAPTTRLTTALADRYTIERELGQGGMATVYLAEDLKHKRHVALKVLKPELAAVLGAERFVQEITTTAALQHPHILPLFDSGVADTFLYYVMPFIDGETLRSKLNRETQLGIEEAVKIAVAVAEALDYAHRHGVIHRDIKPENILLHEGRPMVADFGIALAVSAAAGGRMTETGLSLGTPHYMSPEQATAEKEITARSDVYSLASVLYEMLTGNPPHTGASAQQIIMKIVTEQAAPVTTLRRTVPPQVAAAIAKALEKLPADRFESAAEFAEVLQGRRTLTIAAGQMADAGARRNPWVVAGVAAGIGAVLTALALVFLSPSPSEPLQYWTITPPTGLDTIPLPRVFALAPDASRLVYATLGPAGKQVLAARALSEPEGSLLPGTEDGQYPVFSPGGDRVAFIAPPGVLKWVSLNGGAPQVLGNVGPGAMCWAEDQHIYFSRDGTNTLKAGLSRVPERGGSVEIITVIDSTPALTGHSCFQVLADRGILLQLNRSGGMFEQQVGAFDSRTGQTTVLASGGIARVIGEALVVVTPTRSLAAAPFDQSRLTLTGPFVALADNIYANRDGFSSLAADGPGNVLVTAVAEPELSRLTWVDRQGRATPIDDSNPQEFRTFAFSPDEDRIAAGVTREGVPGVWLYTLPSGPWTRLMGTEQSDEYRPAWDPAGNRISFIAGKADEARSVWVVGVDGGGPPQQLRRADPVIIQDGEFSSDGAWFVYREGPSGSTLRDLAYSRPHPDSARIPLVATAADEFAPTLSPDGRWLAYVTNTSGREEVVVQPFPGPGRRTQVSLDGGFEPRWAHSGRELFFRDRAGNLVAVDVTTGGSFAVLGRRVLFSALKYLNDRNSILYDVSNDDQRFLFLEPVSGGEVTWRLVRGFANELKAKVKK